MSSRTSLTEASLRPAVLVLFACWLFAAMGQHGMWLDEMQHWCLARDSNDLVDLFHNTRNEGHPPLWHLLLFFITRTTSDPVAMQVLHGLIALCSIYLVLWHAPFPLSWRVLLVFGYFFAFEYAVISRNYGPTLLALLCATSCYRNRNYWGWAVACLFMAAGHLWGIVFAAVWATMDIYHAGLQRRSLLPPVAVLATAGLMVWRCIPGTMGTTGIELFGSPVPNMLARMGTITHMAMLPWPDLLSESPWDHQLIHAHSRIASLIIGSILIGSLWLLRPEKPWSQLLFALCAIGCMCIPIFLDLHSTRYYGPVFIAWILGLWLSDGKLAAEQRRRTVTMLLSAQVIGTAGAALMLWSRPIEQAKELVATIRVHHLDELPVVVTAYTAGPAISGYLQRPVYYPNIGGPGSWVEWRRASDPVREQDVSELVGRYDLDRYLLVTAPLGSGPEQRVNVEAIASFMEGQREHARVKLFLVTPSVTPNMAPTDLTGQP